MTQDSEVFRPDAKSILEVFGNVDSYYQIPDYQRPYSWTDKQISDLWEDLYAAMEAEDPSYFLGPIILIQKPDGYYEVVDGQQRLTTLTILFCVVRDLYEKEIRKRDSRLAERIVNSIISNVDKEDRLKLITQAKSQNEFKEEVLKEVRFPEGPLSQKEKKKQPFMNAAQLFKERLADLRRQGRIHLVISFLNYLFTRVDVITITCSRQAQAIKLFQVINTRGLDLSNADLVKSYLYGRVLNKKEGDQFIATWNEIETVSKDMDESIDDLLTYYEYFLLASNPRKTVYEELEAKFKKRDPNEVIYDFRTFVDSYKKLYDKKSKVVYTLWYLPNQVYWKAIITTAIKEDFKNIDGLTREIRRFYYCYWIGGFYISKIKQFSFNIIGWIKEGRDLAFIKNSLDHKLVEDKVADRVRENIANDAYDANWLKPLLVMIEYEKTDGSKLEFLELNRNIHVDHILPEKWSTVSYWKSRWSNEDATAWLNRMGNLTLLSGRKNCSAQNWAFDKKKDVYRGKGFDGTTAFLITQALLSKRDWTTRQVKARQKSLVIEAERLLKVG